MPLVNLAPLVCMLALFCAENITCLFSSLRRNLDVKLSDLVREREPCDGSVDLCGFACV